jgi:hypothetical protein
MIPGIIYNSAGKKGKMRVLLPGSGYQRYFVPEYMPVIQEMEREGKL